MCFELSDGGRTTKHLGDEERSELLTNNTMKLRKGERSDLEFCFFSFPCMINKRHLQDTASGHMQHFLITSGIWVSERA